MLSIPQQKMITHYYKMGINRNYIAKWVKCTKEEVNNFIDQIPWDKTKKLNKRKEHLHTYYATHKKEINKKRTEQYHTKKKLKTITKL